MIELLLLIGLVYWIGTAFGDSAGVIALAVLIGFVLILFIGACRDGNRAYGNWVRYLADGGPEKRRNQRYRSQRYRTYRRY